MSKKHEKIVSGLKLIASSFGPDALLDGTVAAVYGDSYTCDVQLDSDGSTLYGCRLRATAAGRRSIDVMPPVGAAVVLGRLGSEEYLVLACDEISSYRVTAGSMVLTVDDAGIGLNNGGDSLKAILTDLVNGILTIYAPKDIAAITALLERIDELLQ